MSLLSTLPPAPELTVDTELNTRLRSIADNLARELAPWRKTRPHGHEAIRDLLADPDSRPALIAEINTMLEYRELFCPFYMHYWRRVEAWRQECAGCSAARREEIMTTHQPRTTSALLNGLKMLAAELHEDLERITAFDRAAFTYPPKAPEWPANHP